MRPTPFSDPRVEAAFAAYPPAVRAPLLALRRAILEVAGETPAVGPLVETLKWGQPAYLPARPRIGSTVRIDALKGRAGAYAAFFHCQSELVPTFRDLYGDALTFEGRRAVVFAAGEAVAWPAVRHCLALALTYHLRARA